MNTATSPQKDVETPLERAVREAVAAAPPLSEQARDEASRLLSKAGAR